MGQRRFEKRGFWRFIRAAVFAGATSVRLTLITSRLAPCLTVGLVRKISNFLPVPRAIRAAAIMRMPWPFWLGCATREMTSKFTKRIYGNI